MSATRETLSIRVTDASAVGYARRMAVALAAKLGLDETRAGELALMVTEAGTNLLQHARGGELLLRPLLDPPGVELIALDQGPGMASVAQCMADGYSTGGSRGVGLGSIARMADELDVFSRPGAGTALRAIRLAARRTTVPHVEVGGVCVAYPGEDVSGDTWATQEREGSTLVMVIDGLGHGLLAYEAATAAAIAFDRPMFGGPRDVLAGLHAALSGTRGAAGAVAEIDWRARRVRFAGIGNVAGSVVLHEFSQSLTSHNGILGERQPRFQEFEYPWPTGATLLLHSDGISTRWNLGAYPGLAAKHPGLVAAVLYRDFCRRRDDATVVGVRETQAGVGP